MGRDGARPSRVSTYLKPEGPQLGRETFLLKCRLTARVSFVSDHVYKVNDANGFGALPPLLPKSHLSE